MIAKEKFELIKEKYGYVASWAVWVDADEKPKSNIGDLGVFDINKNPHLLEQLKPEVVMVGLNFARTVEKKIFGNFHDPSPYGQDYKIRYAFQNTKYYGAYMTDIIKDLVLLEAGNVVSHLKNNPEFEKQNIELFRKELADLGAVNPLLIAFGNDAFNVLNKYFTDTYEIIKVPHYSNHISKENYKSQINNILKNIK